MRSGAHVHATYRTPLVTIGLSLVVVIWSLGALAMLTSVVVGRAPIGILAGATFGVLASGAMAALVRHRVRTMGRFTLDFDANVLAKLGSGDRPLATWPLDGVRFESRWDPFHRSFVLAYWLIARTPDGLGLRIGKGDRDAVAHAIAQLEALRGRPAR